MENFFFNLPLTTRSLRSLTAYGSLALSLLLLAISQMGCDLGTSQLTSITISPSTAIVGINMTQSFAASGRNNWGYLVSITPTWSVSGGIGTISSSGLFTAASTPATGYVIASTEGITAQATVTVTNEAKVSGTITDQSGQKVNTIKVYSRQNSTRYSTSDSNGAYSFWVPAGTQEIRTEESLPYLFSSSEVTLASGESKTLNFTLNPRLQISNVSVTTTALVQINYTLTNAGTREVSGVTVAYVIYNKENLPAASAVDTIGNLSAGQSQNRTVYGQGVSIGNYGSYSLTAAAQKFQ